MEQIQYGTIRIGQIVKLFTDSIGLDALLEVVSEKEKNSTKKMIQRLEKEEGIRIDNLRQFENLLSQFFKIGMENHLLNKSHNYVVLTLYHDLLALITTTSPYNNPTQKEVELQTMYCISLTFREIYDYLLEKNRKTPGETLQLALGMFDFWKHTNYTKDIELISSCFETIFSDINGPKSLLFEYWDSIKDTQEDENKKTKTSYSKTVTDWSEKKVCPSWKLIKYILSSATPQNIDFKNIETNYELFKGNLFIAYFFSNFFRSLETQNLISIHFKNVVQRGIRWFYYHLFAKNGDFSLYTINEIQNPMFSFMRFMVHPSDKNRCLISEYIYEAFDKEIGLTPAEMYECKSLYYIPLDRIQYPFLKTEELESQLNTFQLIYETFMELSTWKNYGVYENKIVKENEIEYVFSHPAMGECKPFFYNWFIGKYHVLCRNYGKGLEYYKKAFDYRYFGGKILPVYLEEIIVLMNKCNCKQIEFNHIHEWANAVCLYIQDIDKGKGKRYTLKNTFDEVFPKEAFIVK